MQTHIVVPKWSFNMYVSAKWNVLTIKVVLTWKWHTHTHTHTHTYIYIYIYMCVYIENGIMPKSQWSSGIWVSDISQPPWRSWFKSDLIKSEECGCNFGLIYLKRTCIQVACIAFKPTTHITTLIQVTNLKRKHIQSPLFKLPNMVVPWFVEFIYVDLDLE